MITSREIKKKLLENGINLKYESSNENKPLNKKVKNVYRSGTTSGYYVLLEDSNDIETRAVYLSVIGEEDVLNGKAIEIKDVLHSEAMELYSMTKGLTVDIKRQILANGIWLKGHGDNGVPFHTNVANIYEFINGKGYFATFENIGKTTDPDSMETVLYLIDDDLEDIINGIPVAII